jgi:hypothetical protein
VTLPAAVLQSGAVAGGPSTPSRRLFWQPITSYFHDWRADPFAVGAYTYVAVGGLETIERLARPFEDTYFAGEATDTEGHWSTVHATIATGYRAAGQVIKAYKPMA